VVTKKKTRRAKTKSTRPAIPEGVKAPKEELRIEYPQGSPTARRALVFVASLYLLGMFMAGVSSKLNGRLWQPILLFCQTAALFPYAATHSIEYRAQGYTCSGHVIEIDVRPYFPIHADDKENRFSRAMHFVRSEPIAMEALEAYVMREYNRAESDKIGGVSFVGLYSPIPQLGTSFPRNEYAPLAEFPKDARKVIHVTPHETVLRRCKEGGL
jgi:hypothetical protein